MKKLLVYLNDYKKECVLAPLFKMLEAIFELIVPLVCAVIIDVGIANRDKAVIFKMCGWLLLLAVIGLAASVTAQYFAAKAAVGFAARLRHALFRHLQSFSFTEIDTLGTSTMVTRMTSDVNQAQTGVNMVLRLFLRSPFVVFGAMLMAFTIDGKAALNFVAAILLLFVVVFAITYFNIPMIRAVQKKLDEVLKLTRENLLGVRVIRAFCKEEEEAERFLQRNEALTKQQKKAGSISALMNPVTYVIINLAILHLIWTGALQVEAGVLTQGQVIALYNYMSQILVELIKFANLIITLNKALASGNRIADVFTVKNSMVYGADASDAEGDSPAVAFKGVSLQYQSAEEESLTDITFTANQGEIIGIIGGTGSGKTSLVHLIARFYDAVRGEVLIQGKNVKAYTQEALNQKIGIVLQKAVLFKGTVKSNLEFANPNATQEEMWEAIRIAQAEDVVKGKGGLSGEVSQEGKNFSGGQRQRLTIARALVKKPSILILDDSASALDMATDAKLRKALRQLSYHPVIFIVSQRTSAIKDADRILVLDDGMLVGQGTHDELVKSCDVYREIYESQYRTGVQDGKEALSE